MTDANMTDAEALLEAATLAASIDEAERLAYVRMLATFDFDFEFTDDHRKWQRCREERATLMRMQAALDPKFLLWNLIAPRAHWRQ